MRVAALLLLTGCDRMFGLLEVTLDDEADAAIDAPTFPADLVAYYPLDMSAGNRTAELVGGNDALCAVDRCPTPTADVRDALDFDGVDDMLQVPPIPALETTGAFTLMVWMRQDAPLTTDDFGCPLSKRYGTVIENTWQLCIRDFGTPNLGFVSTGTTSSPSDAMYLNEAYPLNEWHHVAMVWDGTTKELFVDGTRKAFGLANVAFDGGDVLIGADIDIGQQVGQFPGQLDEVRIYNRAPSATEILAVMQ